MNNSKYDLIPLERKREILKEELRLVENDSRIDNIGSISDQEIEELLRNYFVEIGKIPEDINRLSVLFPVLEKAGLGEFVEAYNEIAQTRGRKQAMRLLEDIKMILQDIMVNPNHIPTDDEDKEE